MRNISIINGSYVLSAVSPFLFFLKKKNEEEIKKETRSYMQGLRSILDPVSAILFRQPQVVAWILKDDGRDHICSQRTHRIGQTYGLIRVLISVEPVAHLFYMGYNTWLYKYFIMLPRINIPNRGI